MLGGLARAKGVCQAYPPTKTAPWQHQREGLAKALSVGPAFFFAWDMGSGKSKGAVDYCNAVDAHTVLILCPQKVITVWAGDGRRPSQFDLHSAADFQVVGLEDGTGRERAARAAQALDLAQRRGRRLVVVANYEAAWREPLGPSYDENNRLVSPGLLLGQRWDVVALDESHRVKSPGGRASLFCAKLREVAKRRLCLSGTPCPHSPLDMFGQYRFLNPAIFGPSFFRFKKRYAITGGSRTGR